MDLNKSPLENLTDWAIKKYQDEDTANDPLELQNSAKLSLSPFSDEQNIKTNAFTSYLEIDGEQKVVEERMDREQQSAMGIPDQNGIIPEGSDYPIPYSPDRVKPLDWNNKAEVEQEALSDLHNPNRTFYSDFVYGFGDIGRGFFRSFPTNADNLAYNVTQFMNNMSGVSPADGAKVTNDYFATLMQTDKVFKPHSKATVFGHNLGELSQSITEFMAPWWGSYHVLKKAVLLAGMATPAGLISRGGMLTASALAGVLTSYLFEREQHYGNSYTNNFAKMLTQLDPITDGALTRWMVSSPDDWFAEKHRQALSTGLSVFFGDLLIPPVLGAAVTGTKKLGGALVPQFVKERFMDMLAMERFATKQRLWGKIEKGKKEGDGTLHIRNTSGIEGDTIYIADKKGNINFYQQLDNNPGFGKVFQLTKDEIRFSTPRLDVHLPKNPTVKEIQDFWNGPAFQAVVDSAPTPRARIEFISELARRTAAKVERSSAKLERTHPEPDKPEDFVGPLQKREKLGKTKKAGKQKEEGRLKHKESFGALEKEVDEYYKMSGIDMSEVKAKEGILGKYQRLALSKLELALRTSVSSLKKQILDRADGKFGWGPTRLFPWKDRAMAGDTELANLHAKLQSDVAQWGEISDILQIHKREIGRVFKQEQEIKKKYETVPKAGDRVANGLQGDLLSPHALRQATKDLRDSKLGDLDPVTYAKMLDSVEQQAGVAGLRDLAQNGSKASGMDMFLEHYKHAVLLSSPATLGLQLATNTLTVASNLPIRAIAGTIGSTKRMLGIANHNDPVFTEFFGALTGFTNGLWKGLLLSVKAATTKQSAFVNSHRFDITNYPKITARNAGLDGTSLGLGLNAFGMATRFFGHSILTVDEFFKTVSYETAKGAAAWRYAANTTRGVSNGKNRLQSFFDVMKTTSNNPDRFSNITGQSIDKESVGYALLDTMQRELGTTGKSLQRAFEDIKPLQIQIPFMKVLANLPKYFIRHSPIGLGIQSKEFKAGGAERTMEYARMAYGLLISYMFYGLTDHGLIKIGDTEIPKPFDPNWGGHQYTVHGYGAGTSIEGRRTREEIGRYVPFSLEHINHNKRDENGQPIRHYFKGLDRLAPFGMFASTIDDLVYMTNSQKYTIDELAHAWAGAANIGRSIAIHPTWMPNLHKLGVALVDEGKEMSSLKEVGRIVAGLDSTAMEAKLVKESLPYVIGTGPAGMTAGSRSKGKLPDFRYYSYAATKRGPTGQKIRAHHPYKSEWIKNRKVGEDAPSIIKFIGSSYAGEHFSVLEEIAGANDNVAKWIGDTEYATPKWHKDFKIGDLIVPMSYSESEDYQHLSTTLALDLDGNTLYDRLNRMVNSSYFKSLPYESYNHHDQKTYINNLFSTARDLAKNAVIQSDKHGAKIRQRSLTMDKTLKDKTKFLSQLTGLTE